MRRPAAGLALLLAAACPHAGEPRNWFGDPFFQVRNAVPGCPVPRGPFMDDEEMRHTAHARVERGTSCWLAGQCAEPNAYLGDPAVAEEVRRRFAASKTLRESSLWVTVQRHVVFVEGCAGDRQPEARVNALLRGMRGVDAVVVNIAGRPSDHMPYRRLDAR